LPLHLTRSPVPPRRGSHTSGQPPPPSPRFDVFLTLLTRRIPTCPPCSLASWQPARALQPCTWPQPAAAPHGLGLPALVGFGRIYCLGLLCCPPSPATADRRLPQLAVSAPIPTSTHLLRRLMFLSCAF
jgi:hypothetical protein